MSVLAIAIPHISENVYPVALILAGLSRSLYVPHPELIITLSSFMVLNLCPLLTIRYTLKISGASVCTLLSVNSSLNCPLRTCALANPVLLSLTFPG